MNEKIKEIAHNLRTQDNRITANPVFVVQQKIRDYGIDTGWGYNGFIWVNKDGEEVDVKGYIEEYMEEFLEEAMERDGKIDLSDKFEKRYYRNCWEFVTACFTEQGCKDYIEANGHNLKETRIYVESGYRNKEWEIIREYLMGEEHGSE